MSTSRDLPASEVYMIGWEPTARLGRLSMLLHKVMAPFSGQLIPGDGHPVVYERATGNVAKGSHAALTGMIKDMEADLETMTAGEFRARYLDV